MSKCYRFPHKEKVTFSLTGKEEETQYIDPWGQDWDHNAEDVFCSFPAGTGGCKKSHDSALQWCVWVHREPQSYFPSSSPLAFSSSFSSNCFQAPCQDVHSRSDHDSFTHECHTETSSSKSPLTPTMISNSKTWLFPYICSLKTLSSIRVHLSTRHLQSQRWVWSQGHLHSWSSSPMSHDGYMPGINRHLWHPEVLTHRLELPASLSNPLTQLSGKMKVKQDYSKNQPFHWWLTLNRFMEKPENWNVN